MFERYTEKARRVIFFARFEASQFGSPYIETEHLLLGLLREDKEITRLFLPPQATALIRQEIEHATEVREKVSTSVDLPLTNDSKRILVFAAEEADRLGHKHIGTEHLLLGILREEKSFAAVLLHPYGLRISGVREKIARLPAEPAGRAAAGMASRSAGETATLADFGTNLTQLVMDEDGGLQPLIGRQEELAQVVQVLGRLDHGNAVLVGEPGVGKKTIIHGLAKLMADDSVPGLEGKSMVAIDLAVIGSGTTSRRRFEESLSHIASDLIYGQGGILFVEDLHSLAASRREFLYMANVLKPALACRSVQCISTATPSEYRKATETERWLQEWFHVVEVRPPDDAHALEILKGIKQRYEQFHEVTYTDEALQYAIFHSNNYLPRLYLPEKAIDLLDDAGARVNVTTKRPPDDVVELRQRLRFIVGRKEAAITNHEFEKARFYSDEEATEREKLQQLLKQYKLDQKGTVTRADIEEAVSRRTGIAVEAIRKSSLPGL